MGKNKQKNYKFQVYNQKFGISLDLHYLCTVMNKEGSTVEELTKDFEEAIDDYLALCEEKGIEPRKPYSGVLNVRLTPEIHSGAAIAAQKEGITINAFIKNAVARALGMVL